MISKKVNGEAYGFEPKDLSKIDFSTIQDSPFGVYYAKTDKMILLPIRYSLKAKNKKEATLGGHFVLPKSYGNISARTTLSYDKVLDAFISCLDQNIGLQDEHSIKIRINAINKVLYQKLLLFGSDFIVTGVDYDFKAFLIKDGKVIGIGTQTNFTKNEDGALDIQIQNARGPYLSSFNSEKDKNVHLVILQDDGKAFLAIRAEIHNVYNQKVTATKTSSQTDTNSQTAKLCEEVYRQYDGKYNLYFLNHKTTERSDEFEDFEL